MENEQTAYGYARVSSAGQNEDRQIIALKEMGRPPKSLLENFYEVYQERAMGKVSGVEAARKCNMPESTFRYKAITYKILRCLFR